MNRTDRIVSSVVVMLVVYGTVVCGKAPAVEDVKQATTGSKSNAPVLSCDTYTQRLQITFTDEASAEKAAVKICELYHGYQWAVGARWDDNSPTNIRMMRLMDKYGIRGTFYLNGREQSYWGPRFDYEGSNSDIDKILVASARHSIGGHGWRHPSLGYCNRNRIWTEIMRVRADREASSDTPLCSYSMSNMSWSNELEGKEPAGVIAEALLRAGFYHNANAKFTQAADVEMPASNLLPWDGASVERVSRQFEQYLQDERLRQENPNISFSMHAPAHQTEGMWKKLEQKFAKYTGRPNWWYCNQSQYAAYRMQFMLSKVKSRVEGRKLLIELTRPLLVELNDPVPITLELVGVTEDKVASVKVSGAQVERVDSREGLMFDVFHDTDMALPGRIGWIHNLGVGMDKAIVGVDEFEFMEGMLYARGDELSLGLKNMADEPLKDIRMVFRGPLMWQDGRKVVTKDDLEPGEDILVNVKIEDKREEFEYRCGVEFYAAQVDCVVNGKAIRGHFTTERDSGAEDAIYPVGRFAVAGPISKDVHSEKLAKQAAKAGAVKLQSPDGTEIEWRSTKEMTDFLCCEGVYAKPPAAERMLKGYYLIKGIVSSDSKQSARFEPSGRRSGLVEIFVNGSPVSKDNFELRAGKNRLLLIYNADRKRALLLRLVSPKTGERLKNIRYSSPKLLKEG